ncbi:MAG: methylmalonyl-CoA mutase family protein [Bacteroidota bacterium]|nr:methylmalonyl-CoA mutase family protein [Bacteroidota bacterium]
MKNRNLFDQFPPVSTKEWMDKINADLKGADFNKRLVWRTAEGFDVMPFYRREDLADLNHIDSVLSLYLKPDSKGKPDSRRIAMTGNSWLIRQDITVTDFSTGNHKALSLLSKGVDSIGFIITDPESIDEKHFYELLKGIDPSSAEINFLSNGKALEIIDALIKTAVEYGFDVSLLRGAVEADPLGRLMTNGTLCIPVDEGFDYLASLVRAALTLPNYRSLQINGSNFVNAGSDSVRELAFSISMGVEYLDQLTGRGINAGEAAGKMRFSFGTGSAYFMEIAKLRAARVLWSLIGDKYQPAEKDPFRMEIHSITSDWNTTMYDPYINMLRTQTEAMSAVLGGTDSLTVKPYDSAFRISGDFSERIARNQQLILKEEAFFDRVADPASGSYYIEKLTALIAENAWKLFLEIEETGGFLSALTSGFIQKQIAESSAAKKNGLTKRKEILVGTNLYPDPEEKFTLNENIKSSPRPSELQDLLIEPLRSARGSEDFEKLRLAVEKAPKRPVAFMLTLGNQVMRRARSQFSAGFFGCAGYRIIESDGFGSADEGCEAAIRSDADIVVICSSDEEYALYAPVINKKLEGKAIMVVAGNPPDIEELKSMGIRNFISVRSDVLESLTYFNSCLGIGQ